MGFHFAVCMGKMENGIFVGTICLCKFHARFDENVISAVRAIKTQLQINFNNKKL